MKALRSIIILMGISLMMASCLNNENGNSAKDQGSSTPIDSTNVNGTAPATYGGNNPANDQKDSNRVNANDTGTNASNVHNTPAK